MKNLLKKPLIALLLLFSVNSFASGPKVEVLEIIQKVNIRFSTSIDKAIKGLKVFEDGSYTEVKFPVSIPKSIQLPGEENLKAKLQFFPTTKPSVSSLKKVMKNTFCAVEKSGLYGEFFDFENDRMSIAYFGYKDPQKLKECIISSMKKLDFMGNDEMSYVVAAEYLIPLNHKVTNKSETLQSSSQGSRGSVAE